MKKKSFLLYTVSGVIFCSSSLSYALNLTSPLLLTKDFLSTRPTADTPTDRSANSKSTGDNISESITTETDTESRRRQDTFSRFTNLITKKNLPSSLVSTQADSAKPAPKKQEQIENVHSTAEAKDGKTITLHNAKVQDRNFAVIADGKNSIVNMLEGTVTANFVALNASNGGTIDATGVTVTAASTGLVNINGIINLKDSTVHVTSIHGADGIVFRNNPYIQLENDIHANAERRGNTIQKQNLANQVTLNNTQLFVKNGAGISIYGANMDGEVSLKDSAIYADILLQNTKEKSAPAHSFMLNTNNSYLEGRVKISGENETIFDLKNGTKWLLKTNQHPVNNDKNPSDYSQFSVDEKSYSNLSTLKLTDSAIIFGKPVAGHYQTLFVGSNSQQGDKPLNALAAYSATGAAEIYLNTKWSNHSPVLQQETDRLLINGDVSGTTVIHVNLLEKNKKLTDSSSVGGKHMASAPLSTQGVSIIQVSGKANENSFKLAGNYMAISGLPYKYVLTAYAPGTSHASQNLFGKNDNNFWDFRLQNAYIDSNKKIRALLPQVANYLVMPNTLFASGFSDVNNQNTLLGNMRTTMFGAENNKKNAIFVSSYGEKLSLSSNRDSLHYGYDADVNYTAIQLGIVLATLESKNISTHFGLLGTYGTLTFIPKNMEDSKKTTLNKWSLTAYNDFQHSNGIYVNTLLSYGTVKGNITTALIGNVAKLDSTETLSVSTTIGQKLATGTKGLIFEPQAQFTYQNLMFDVLSDANDFEVDMNNPHQWLIRVGGRLTQNLTTIEEDNTVSFYGKLNMIKAFGDGETIKIVDTFYLDPTGSSIEVGVGVNALFSQKIALYGDISYRQKLQRAGVSGTNFSGGIRYHF